MEAARDLLDPKGTRRREENLALRKMIDENSPFGEAVFDFDSLKVIWTNKRFREGFEYKMRSDLHLIKVVHALLPPDERRDRHGDHIKNWKASGCPNLTLGMRGHTNLHGYTKLGNTIEGLLIEIRADETNEEPPRRCVMAWIIFPGTFGVERGGDE